jgi:hypothetical protein
MSVFASYANNPLLFANAFAVARHSINPVATSPFFCASDVTCVAAAARSAGVGILNTICRGAGYVCAPNSGIRSGLGGTNFAISVACFAAADNDASSVRLVVMLALRFPTNAVITTVVSRFSPDVVTWLSANRVSARAALVIDTRVSSAGELRNTRCAISCASARDNSVTGAKSECGAPDSLVLMRGALC